jgi:hypothetical protein
MKKKKRVALTWTGSNLRGTRHVGSMTALYFIRSSVTFQDHHHLCTITVPSVTVTLEKQWVLYLQEIFKHIPGVQHKSGPYFNISNLFTKIYNMLYYTTKLYLQ